MAPNHSNILFYCICHNHMNTSSLMEIGNSVLQSLRNILELHMEKAKYYQIHAEIH